MTFVILPVRIERRGESKLRAVNMDRVSYLEQDGNLTLIAIAGDDVVWTDLSIDELVTRARG